MAVRSRRRKRRTTKKRKATKKASVPRSGAVVLTAAQFKTLLDAARKGKTVSRRRRANPFEEEVLSMYDYDYAPWVGDFAVKFPSTSSTKKSSSTPTVQEAGEPIPDEVPTQQVAKIS